jgi:hypothetical protein
MGNSGIEWVDNIFDICVIFLVELAKLLGISYEEINIWIFCVIYPVVILLLCYQIVRLNKRKCKCLKKPYLNL